MNSINAIHITFDLAASDLDHPSWLNAEPIHIDRYWSGDEALEGRHTEVHLLWSDEALCVRFTCAQTERLIVNPSPQTDEKTLNLWDRDVCEIFLAPNPERPERYFEFEAAPTGEWVDLAIQWSPDQRETDWKYQSGMSAAARVEANRVIIAMRIPWSDGLPKPAIGGRWRANLFRCVGEGELRGYLGWRPTLTAQPNFHMPQAFGWLVFAPERGHAVR